MPFRRHVSALPAPALPCLPQLAARHSVEPGLRLWVADSGHAAYMGVFCAFVALFALLQLSRLPLPSPCSCHTPSAPVSVLLPLLALLLACFSAAANGIYDFWSM